MKVSVEKKRYLLENDLISGGGAEQVMKSLVDKLLREGHDVTVAVRKGNRKDFYKLYPREVKFYLLEFPWLDNVKRFTLRWALQRIRYTFFCIRRFWLNIQRFDIAVAMKEGPCMQDVALRKATTRYGWVHVDYRYIYWTKKYYQSVVDEVECFRQMNRVVCVSQAAAEGVVKTIGDPGNLVVCYNPIDAHIIREKATEKCQITRKEDRPLFVSVGRLAREKQFTMLLEVCNRLSKQYEFELWIIGDGPERNKLEKMIEQWDIHCVKLLGSQENPYSYMKQADCFVSTSVAESYGLAIQEALILGIPVLATECPAMWETIPEGSGMIVPNDPENLFHAMESVIQNREILECLCTNINARNDKKEWYETRLNEIYQTLEG